MPLGLDDDELEAFIGIYKLRPNSETKDTRPPQRQRPGRDSCLSLATGASTRHDLSCGRGREQEEKELQHLSPVEEERSDSLFSSPVTASPRTKATIHSPREGKGDTKRYSFLHCYDEAQQEPRKLTHSASLPPISSLQCQPTPARSTFWGQFSWAGEFEKELRDIEVQLNRKTKARSAAKKSSHVRSQSATSSTSSSQSQIQKGTLTFWKVKKDAHLQGTTSSSTNTDDGVDAAEQSALSAAVPPRHTNTEKRSSTRFDWLVKHSAGLW
ncbi:hypothetical protein AYO21_03553 [Fonsecaea monophora]|uniref:Uncharacterized protein n=1 Tax=Fonsecaea monophora TaxID=254056 RepID=A0A177FFU5_9EURO|nr:hypothetical protein AYO21_03553 [Fonsecaea monophora]OAG42099.1 hypothetical protein AYO21_03553 [Fonsecaea monophora]